MTAGLGFLDGVRVDDEEEEEASAWMKGEVEMYDVNLGTFASLIAGRIKDDMVDG